MAMQEMQKTIAELRLLLAALRGKEEELNGQVYQFKRQLDHAPAAAVRGSSIESSLNAMGEIQERLDSVQQTRDHLNVIKIRAQDELRPRA